MKLERSLQTGDVLNVFIVGILCLIFHTLYKYWKQLKCYSELPTFTIGTYFSYYDVLKAYNKKPKQKKFTPPECYLFRLLCKQCRFFQDGLHVFWLFVSPYIFIYKSELIKEIICHPAALTKAPVYDVLRIFFGNGLSTSKGETWFSHRKLITPAFHLRVLRNYISIFNEQSNILVGKLKEIVQEPWIDIGTYIENCTIDALCKAAMDIDLGCQTGNEYGRKFIKQINAFAKLAAHKALRPWTQHEYWFHFIPYGRKMLNKTNNASRFMNEIISERMQALKLKKIFDTGEVWNKSFLEILLEYHEENPKFTMQDVQDEANTFVAAGHHTVTDSVKWTIFLVGLDSKVQENIIEEMDSVFEYDSDRPVTYQDLSNLAYLECVIKESMRLYPPVPLVARELSQDVQVGKYKLFRGSTLIFNIYMLHRDTEYFPDPESFKPERFLPENCQNINSFAYLPFSAGPRNCIGQKFAMMEMKIMLCHIFRNFRVESYDQREDVRCVWGISLDNLEPIRTRFIPRYQ